MFNRREILSGLLACGIFPVLPKAEKIVEKSVDKTVDGTKKIVKRAKTAEEKIVDKVRDTVKKAVKKARGQNKKVKSCKVFIYEESVSHNRYVHIWGEVHKATEIISLATVSLVEPINPPVLEQLLEKELTQIN